MGGQWFTVNREIPCPVCEKSTRCRVTPNREDPMVVSCYQKDTYLGKGAFKTNDGAAGTSYLHRLKDSPEWESRPKKRRSTKRTSVPEVVATTSTQPESDIAMDDFASREPVEPVEPPNMELRHRVYSRLLELCPVSFDHITENTSRGLDAKKLGYGTLPGKPAQKKAVLQLIGQFTSEALLTVPGFVEKEPGEISINSGAGLLVPCRNRICEIVRIVRRDPNPLKKDNKWRPLSGGTHHDGTDGASAGVTLHWARLPEAGGVIITEGERKADSIAALTTQDMGVVSVPGVGSWRSAGLIADLELLGVQLARIAYDADFLTNIAVGRAALQVATALGDVSIKVEFAVWDPAYKGMDDALVGKAEIRTLSGDDALAHREAIAAKHGLRLDGQKLPDSRPVFKVDDPQDQLLRQALALLEKDDLFYLKGGALVTPKAVNAKNADNVTSSGPVRLAIVSGPLVAARIADLAQWFDKRDQTAGVPRWLADRILETAGAMTYSGPRAIVGILSGPTIDEKGNLINSAGYHLIGSNGWYMGAPVEGLNVPERCTLAVCQAAVARIKRAVEHFPWATDLDFPKWLVGLIAANARTQVDVTPMMLITAHSAGAGKSYLVKMISWILFGLESDVAVWPMDDRNRDDELRKRLSGLVQSGATLAVLDNLPTGSELSSPVLCAFLTGAIFKDRRLGVNDGTESGGVNRVFLIGNGNNIAPMSDLADRVFVVNLDAPEENRRLKPVSEYGSVGDAIIYCKDPENRRELLEAVLTIRRGYIQAGRPDQPGDSWGTYDEFVKACVDPVRWATSKDPLQDRRRVLAEDPAGEALTLTQSKWGPLYPDQWMAPGKVVKELTYPNGIHSDSEEGVALREALSGIGKTDTAQGLARALRRVEGLRRSIGGKMCYFMRRQGGEWGRGEYKLCVDMAPRPQQPHVSPVSPVSCNPPAYGVFEEINLCDSGNGGPLPTNGGNGGNVGEPASEMFSQFQETPHTAKKGPDLVETDAGDVTTTKPPASLFGSSAEGPYAYGA